MAPKRRTSTPSTATQSQRAQSTISFHKQGPNRITKPGAQRDAKSKKDASLLDTSRPNATDATLEQPTTADIAIAEQAASTIDELNSSGDGEISVEQPLEADSVTSKPIAPSAKPESAWDSPEGSKARKITDTQIKKYWLAKEQERKAPRVHQEGLTIREKLLREWDMSGQYGVSASRAQQVDFGTLTDF